MIKGNIKLRKCENMQNANETFLLNDVNAFDLTWNMTLIVYLRISDLINMILGKSQHLYINIYINESLLIISMNAYFKSFYFRAIAFSYIFMISPINLNLTINV